MRCKKCNFENREGVKFCEECGEKLRVPKTGLCASCGSQNREGAKFCKECGEKIITPEPALCASCGFQNREGVKFCEECGTPMTGAAPAKRNKEGVKKGKQPASVPKPKPGVAAPPPQTVVVQVQQEPIKRNALWIVLGALGAVVVCCAAFVILPEPLPDNETILPSAVDRIWGNIVNKRNAVVDEGGAVGNLIEAVDNIIPQPVQDVIAGGIGGVVGGKGEPADAAGEEVPINDGGMAGCDAYQVEACVGMGGQVIEDVFLFEGICLCAGEEYNQEWCEKEGGKWNSDFEDCSLVNGCYDVDPTNREEVEALEREWLDLGLACGTLRRREDGEVFEFCFCPNLDNLPDSCESFNESINITSDIICEVSDGEYFCSITFSQQGGFPENVPGVYAIIKFDNGERLNLDEYNRNTSGTELFCYGFDHENKHETAQSGKIYLCQDMCCVYAGEADLSAVDPVFMLTSNCPDPADLEVDKFRYEKGVILFDIIHAGGWEKDEFDGMLVDGLDRDWSGIGCEIDPSDENKMNCRGAGTIRTGKAYIRFDPDTFGPGCENEINIEFPLPRMCPVGQSMCAGSCCSDGHCCTCGGTLGCYQNCKDSGCH